MRQLLTLKTGFIAYFILLGLFSVLMLGVTQHLQHSQKKHQQLEQQRSTAKQLANEFIANYHQLSRLAIAFVSTEQSQYQQHYEQALAQFTALSPISHTPQPLANFQDLGLSLSETEALRLAYEQSLALSQIQIEAISTAAGEFKDQQGNLRIALPDSLMARALIFNQQYAQSIQEIDNTVATAVSDLAARMDQAIRLANTTSQRASGLALIALVVFFLGSTLGLLALYRSIKRPLDQGVNLAHRLAQGKLYAQLASTRQDELGKLLYALNGIGQGLHSTVSQARQCSEFISHSTQALTLTHQELIAGTVEQSQQLTHAVGTLSQLERTVHLNTDKAQNADQLAQAASQHVSQSHLLAQEMLNSMQAIGSQSRQMSEITNLIRDIAFQTNILALNAAVEAARAGQHGKGFAVVAAEVRQLALRSSTASHNIKTLISQSIAQTQQATLAASAMEQATQTTGDTVHKVRHLVSDIAQASLEQALEAEQVSRAMQTVERIAAHNRELVQAATAMATEQNLETDKLHQAMASFSLHAQSPHKPAQPDDTPQPKSNQAALSALARQKNSYKLAA